MLFLSLSRCTENSNFFIRSLFYRHSKIVPMNIPDKSSYPGGSTTFISTSSWDRLFLSFSPLFSSFALFFFSLQSVPEACALYTNRHYKAFED